MFITSYKVLLLMTIIQGGGGGGGGGGVGAPYFLWFCLPHDTRWVGEGQ